MRTYTTKHTVYKFDELSEEAKQKALENLYDINVDHEWWDATYYDADNIGLTIDGFDTDHGTIEGKLTDDMQSVCKSIMAEHGKDCDTYKLAKQYQADWSKLVSKYSDGVTTDQVADGKEDDFDNEADDMTEEFTQQLLEEYLSILRQEFEYLTSEEAIVDTIEANEYEFTKDGELA